MNFKSGKMKGSDRVNQAFLKQVQKDIDSDEDQYKDPKVKQDGFRRAMKQVVKKAAKNN